MASRARAASKKNAVGGDAPKDSIVISWKELQGIRNSATLGRSKDKIHKENAASKQKDDRLARAQRRKEKMIKMETNNKNVSRLTEGEKEKKKADRRTLSAAQTVMDEDMDDVKHMNQIMLYAKVATIRDAQIAEKKERLARERAEEIAADLEREAQRVALLRAESEKQQRRRTESRNSAAEITKQINERKQKRLREQELQAQEAQAMLETVRLVEQKQEEERLEKLAKGRKRLEDVMLANNAQAREKLRRKQEELEEELKIAEYLRQKELREAAEDGEKEHLKAIKDKEIARMRGIQERAIDNRGKLDELRARRYQEEKDREWRRKELAEAQKKKDLIRDMQAARQSQRSEKSRMMAEQALSEREEYFKALEWSKAQRQLDSQARDHKKKTQETFREDLQDQIRQHELEKERARSRFLAEGQGNNGMTEDEERYRLERIRQQKLRELEAAGVPVKYQNELRRKKVLSLQLY
jgi:hypothetical protein